MRWNNSVERHHKGLSNSDSSEEAGTSTTWSKVLSTIESLVDIGSMLILARGPIRPFDIAAVGLKSVHSGMAIYNIWTQEEEIDFESHFTGVDIDGNVTETPWRTVSTYIARMAFAGLEIRETVVPKLQKTKNGKLVYAAYTATVEGCEIGWCGSPAQSSVPGQLWSKNPRSISQLAAKRLWDIAGDDKLVKLQGALHDPIPYTMPDNLIETKFLQQVKRRVDKFLGAGVPRAIILDGEPGTGKTTVTASIAKVLGFRAIVVESTDLVGPNAGYGVYNEDGLQTAAGLTLVQLMRPEILIVNDVDRLDEEDQLKLLDLFDHAKAFAKIIFATTNDYTRLIEPVRRPGRLDDCIPVTGLSRKEIRLVAPDCGELTERMHGWPIAYVKDMQSRATVLGDEGLREIDEVERRLKEIRQAYRGGGGDDEDVVGDDIDDTDGEDVEHESTLVEVENNDIAKNTSDEASKLYRWNSGLRKRNAKKYTLRAHIKSLTREYERVGVDNARQEAKKTVARWVKNKTLLEVVPNECEFRDVKSKKVKSNPDKAEDLYFFADSPKEKATKAEWVKDYTKRYRHDPQCADPKGEAKNAVRAWIGTGLLKKVGVREDTGKPVRPTKPVKPTKSTKLAKSVGHVRSSETLYCYKWKPKVRKTKRDWIKSETRVFKKLEVPRPDHNARDFINRQIESGELKRSG